MLSRRGPRPLHCARDAQGLQVHALDGERGRRRQQPGRPRPPAPGHAAPGGRPRAAAPPRAEPGGGGRSAGGRRRGRVRGRRGGHQAVAAVLRGLRGGGGLEGAQLPGGRAALGAGALRLPRQGARHALLQVPHEAEAPLLPLGPAGAGPAQQAAGHGPAAREEVQRRLHHRDRAGPRALRRPAGQARQRAVAGAGQRVLPGEGRLRLHGPGAAAGRGGPDPGLGR
mmetsp:Transcript_49336/g.157848  ORF Transcript_49336/g.157848 Transcript_49336/m.157848 type:complete len:226 (-) Transcript_49336:66-743(-)